MLLGTAQTYNVDSTHWFSQYFTPSLPLGAVSYTITSVQINMKTGAAQDGTLSVSISAANGSHKPQSNLETEPLYESAASSGFEYVSVNFKNLKNLSSLPIPVSVSSSNTHPARHPSAPCNTRHHCSTFYPCYRLHQQQRGVELVVRLGPLLLAIQRQRDNAMMRQRNGFTIMEAAISVAIVGILMATSMTTMGQIAKARMVQAERRAAYELNLQLYDRNPLAVFR